MELMTKYQYTYFIYPYVIDSNKYERYIRNLLKNKNCKLRLFEKEKDMHLYQYFLPDIRDYMFWSFGLSKKALKNFETLNVSLKANLLAERECNIFKYELSKDLQGKIGEKGGIFFDINQIKLICYKTGICFLVLKTVLMDNKDFTDVLNFNYKFREINSKTYSMKEYENIKLQSDIFKDVREVSTLIKEITGLNLDLKKFNLDNEKMLVYSYSCLDQSSWNEQTGHEVLDNLFEKYRILQPANKQGTDIKKCRDNQEIYQNDYARYGFSNSGTVLLTSDISTANYTTVAQKYESEYLYTYILELYKKFLLKKLNTDFNRTSEFKEVEADFLNFTKKLWIQEITDDEFGKMLGKKWHENLDIEEIFLKMKNKYDILYKKYNVEMVSQKNGKLALAMVVLIVIGVVNIILQLWS